MKTFEITLSVHSRLTLEIQALCEDRLREISVDDIKVIE